MTERRDFSRAEGPEAWTSAQMHDSDRWIYRLSADDVEDLAAALAHVRKLGRTIPFGREDFPLAGFAGRLEEIRTEIERGSGVTLLRGVPVDRFGLEGSRLVYWGIGAHLGTALAQNPRAQLLVDVRDTGGDQYRDPTARGYHTTRRLPFHNDQGDVVGLLCFRRARAGGLSCIASAAAIHNEILATRPDLLAVLYEPYHCDIRGEEPPGRTPYYAEPRFARVDGRLYVQHGRTYIDSAQRFEEVPRLTDAQNEAMSLIDELANSDRFRLDMDFQEGDIQFLNNHVILHSRTDFEDFDEPERKRHLLRLWLRTPGYRVLPSFFERRYDDMDYWMNHPTTASAA